MNSIEFLGAQFPGRVYIKMVEAGAAIGYKPQTCYNMFHKGIFPLPVRKVGANSMVSLLHVAQFLDGQQVVTIESVAPAPRKVGRPTKEEARKRRLS